MTFRQALADAGAASGHALADRVLDACAEHFGLLLKWNRTHNLTRITDPDEAARKHYLDCLVPLLDLRAGARLHDGGALAPLAPASFVDVGSGAGFPGLLAALVWPEASARLVEPARKRASFLTLAAQAMGLRVEVVDPPPEARALHGLAGPVAGAPARDAALLRHGAWAPRDLVLSRATFGPGARRGLVASAGDGIAVWGHPADAATWDAEVATWPGWISMWQPYAVAGLEPRALLWGCPGCFT